MNGIPKKKPPANLFVRRTLPSMVPLIFLGGGNLTEISSKSVCHIHVELHIHKPTYSGVLRTGTRSAERIACSGVIVKFLITCSCHSILCAIDRTTV